MKFIPNFSDTAIITKSNLIKQWGRFRIYEVKFVHKEAYLVTDHPIRKQYFKLHRMTNYKFLGLNHYERTANKTT